MVPYSTWVSEASLVDQVMVAPVLVMFVDRMEERTGGVVSGGGEVAKVRFPLTARFPAASRDLTR